MSAVTTGNKKPEEKKEEVKSEKQESKQEGKKEQSTKKKNVFAQYDRDGLELSMESLLKAGVHFGHQKSRRNPKMDDYIFTTRNNINIIDLSKTVTLIKEALDFLKSVKKSGNQILFVGTKKQAFDLVGDAADYTGNPYVVERWLGGTLTNFGNIRKRARYMTRLRDQIEKGEVAQSSLMQMRLSK